MNWDYLEDVAREYLRYGNLMPDPYMGNRAACERDRKAVEEREVTHRSTGMGCDFGDGYDD